MQPERSGGNPEKRRWRDAGQPVDERGAIRPALTLRDAFLEYCYDDPDAVATRGSLSSRDVSITRAELLRRSMGCALRLHGEGVGHGDHVMLALQTGASFLQWFWATQLLGAVAIPVEPLMSRRRKVAQITHVTRLISIATPRVFVASSGSAIAEQDIRGPRWISEEDFRPAHGSSGHDWSRGSGDVPGGDSPTAHTLVAPTLTPSDVALIQFSSGSTSDPKGCVLSHRAVCANAHAYLEVFGYRRGEATLNWMPLFHDFGLMLGVIAPVLGGMTSILMRTQSFIADPAVWLRGLSGVGPVHTGAPASALALVHARVASREWHTFALQDVRSLICAAEVIHPQTAVKFIELARRYGFSPTAFYPGYGMSETTVMACAKQGLTVDVVRRDNGPRIGAITSPAAPGEATSAFVSLGRAVACAEFRVVDDDGGTLPERRIGHLLLRSECLMNGYLGDSRQTAAILKDGWLSTGDIGYLVDGEFHFVSRSKELIVVAGKKIIPSDIEQAVSNALGLGSHRVASLGYTTSLGTEAIVILIETRAPQTDAIEKVARMACYETTGFQPSLIITSPIGTIPRTSSGKTRREALRCSIRDQLAKAPAPFAPADCTL